jgi:hypothetical protein
MNPFRNIRHLVALLSIAAAIAITVPTLAADAGSWAGEFKNPKHLGGKATFQLSIEQQGSKVQVSFDAVRNDGKGPAPEGQGTASASGDTLQFKFTDNFRNAGTGTIRRSGNDVVLSMKPTRVGNKDAAVFYGDNIQLKRVGKR